MAGRGAWLPLAEPCGKGRDRGGDADDASRPGNLPGQSDFWIALELLGMRRFERLNFRDGFANIFARGYTEILGGDPAYFEVVKANARKEILNR